MNAELIYKHNRNALFAQSILGRGPLLDTALSKIKVSQATDLQKTQMTAELIHAHEKRLLSQLGVFEESDFKKIKGKSIPVLFFPQSNSHESGKLAHPSLLKSASFQTLKESLQTLFAVSQFKNVGIPFRTTGRSQDAFIEGYDDGSFESFVSISHEAGHALVERGVIENSDSGPEGLPLFFEEWLGGRAALARGENALMEFLKYQRKMDALNLAYFGIESGIENPWSISLREWVDPCQDVFRESLVVFTGYQECYARASLQRLGYLKHPLHAEFEAALKKTDLETYSVDHWLGLSELWESLRLLKNISPSAFKIWNGFTSWVAPVRNNGSQTQFASTTFWEPRGLSFLTRSSRAYIPPFTVMPMQRTYALAENLFHESLHQELFFKMDRGDFLMKEFRGEKGPQVQVSWRKTQWHFEHAVHALYVYRELLSMRLDAKNWGIPGLDGAIADSKTAIEELESRIGGFENAFYGEGEKWFKSKAAH